MKKNLLIIFLILAYYSSKAQEYPLMITPEGYILVSVTINDDIPANFILDTGAGVNVVSQKLFDRIETNTTQKAYFTGFRHDGDRLDGIIYEIPSIAIGDKKLNNALIGIYPPLDNFGIDGLLSLKFFEDKPIKIDYLNSKLIFLDMETLEKQDNQVKILPISLSNHRDIALDMSIPVCINDSLIINAEFDTGHGFGPLIMNPYYIESLNLDTLKSKRQAYTKALSGSTTSDYIFQLPINIICNNDLLEKQTVIFREDMIYEGLVGSSLFKEGTVIIDVPGKKFIFSER